MYTPESFNVKPTPSREEIYGREEKTRPDAPAQQSKDFEKILDKDPDRKTDQDIAKTKEKKRKDSSSMEFAKGEIEEDSEGMGVNLFSLASAKAKKGRFSDDLTTHEEKSEQAEQHGLVNEEKEELAAAGEKDESRKPIASLFELSGGQKPKVAAQVQTFDDAPSTTVVQPDKLSKKVSPDKLFSHSYQDTIAKRDEAKLDKKESSTFVQESVDISYVNPLAMVAQPVSIDTPLRAGTDLAALSPVDQAARIQSFVKSMVKELSTVQLDGRIDTIITPEIKIDGFENVKIVVSEFQTAPHQVNITIDGLTQAAKQLLDIQDNINALIASLEKRGIGVHIITTTTLVENPIASEGSAETRQGERGTGGEDERRQNEDDRERNR